jgi:hypothetical protein
MVQTILRQRVRQCSFDMLLPHQLTKILWPPFARQHLITHLFTLSEVAPA